MQAEKNSPFLLPERLSTGLNAEQTQALQDAFSFVAPIYQDVHFPKMPSGQSPLEFVCAVVEILAEIGVDGLLGSVPYYLFGCTAIKKPYPSWQPALVKKPTS